MEPGGCSCALRGGGANRGGQWNGPTRTGEKMTPSAFGAHQQGPGTSSVAARPVLRSNGSGGASASCV
eukprot:5301656-Prymnesium_polylepis.1